MAIVIEMPKLSDTMDAGTLVAWKKNEGDTITAGEVIAEVESDKATMELEAYDGGVLRKIIAKAGDAVPVGQPMAIVTEDPNEDISTALDKYKGNGAATPNTPAAEAPANAAPAETPTSAAPVAAPAAPVSAAPAAPPAPSAPPLQSAPAPAPVADATPRRILASPIAARMAQEFGLDLSLIKGTGPEGRIVKRDIETARASGMTATKPLGIIESAPINKYVMHPELEFEDFPNSNMRKVIAQRLSESKSQIPHYYVTVEIDMKQAVALRKQLNALDGVKISINDFVLKAAALCIEKHPLVNASYQGNYIRVYHRIDIGIAVAMEDGLITPIIRNINKKGLLQISQESRELADRARLKRLKPEEFTGSTFTVSNLGMLGVKSFTAVINPPEAAILAVGGTREVPVIENGQITVGHRMDVTISSDHRVLDGAMSARFLQDFKYYLENPITFAL
jgi:pyruvate dehydrogenase E2 component (dihydrolipoamide acetyltransferase)